MISIRTLFRKEVGQVWNIDRSEVADKIYRFDAGMILEMLINLSSFASPAILIPYFWRNRRWFGTYGF